MLFGKSFTRTETMSGLLTFLTQRRVTKMFQFLKVQASAHKELPNDYATATKVWKPLIMRSIA